jgi:hypothetical protein
MWVLCSCGEHVDEAPPPTTNSAADAPQPERLTLRYLDGLSVGKEYHSEHAASLQASLVAEGRLALVLDLDHTLLHSKLRSALTAQARCRVSNSVPRACARVPNALRQAQIARVAPASAPGTA